MALPFHQYASVASLVDAATLHQHLVSDVEGHLAASTDKARAAIAPQIARWGFVTSASPTTSGAVTDPEEFGSAEVSWSGEEEATGWPALTGRIVITPQADRHARLQLLSLRSPFAELATRQIDRRHRQRIVYSSVFRFLHDLADRLEARTGEARDHDASTPSPGARSFDRTPMFVHHVHALTVDPDTAYERLVSQIEELAGDVTAEAVSRATEALEAGRFREPAAPQVHARVARPDEPATVWIRWSGDEEATGWPEMDLALLIDTHDAGARLVVLSPREPGYDLSRNRVDKQQRHQILQQAGADLATVVADRLATSPSQTAEAADALGVAPA